MKQLISALLLCALMATAHANDSSSTGISWDNIRIGYLTADIDDIDDDATGLNLGVSNLFDNNLLLNIEYTDVSVDIFGADVELTQANIGLGYVVDLDDTSDFAVIVSYLDIEACSFGFCVDDDGYQLDLLYRRMMTDNVEFLVGLAHASVDSESETSQSIGVAYHFTPGFALEFGFSNTDGGSELGLTGRFQY